MTNEVRELRRVDQQHDAIVAMLEELICEIRAGDENPRDMIICWRDREDEVVGYRATGYGRLSEKLGTLAFVQHMIFMHET